jgi:hypothetical protein
MSSIQTNASEVQFVVGEDWSYGPSNRLVAIPVINGDISKEMIRSNTVEGLASKCAGELETCEIICKETPLLQPRYLRDAGDERARFIVKPRDKDVYKKIVEYLAGIAN